MKLHHLIPFIMIVISVSCNKKETGNSMNTGKEIVLRLEPSENNPRNSEGDFVQLKDGRILFIYTKFTGGSGDHAQAHLASRFSNDKGITWSKEDVEVIPNEGTMNIMSVSLLRLSENEIALFYLRKNSETDCIPFMRISSDEGKTWGLATQCIDEPGYYVMNNSRVVQLKSGRIILPVAQHNASENQRFDIGIISCYYSDDEGKSWIESKHILNPDNIKLQEPGIIELDKQKVMLFCRTDAGVQYISYSEDGCENWTSIKPGNIKSPLSPASIKRIPKTGDLLLVWNNNFRKGRDGGKRTPFNIAISKDDGLNWEKTKTIESNPDGWYCYTAIDFVDEHVLLAHCAGDRKLSNGLESTQITRLSFHWIYDTAIPSPFIKSDKNGTIELACNEKEAQIRYTLDGSNPDTLAKIYDKPLQVSKTTLLRMQAFKEGKPESSLVSEYIGNDILQEAKEITKSVLPGLKYKYFEGEIARTSVIEKLTVKRLGICPTPNIKKAENAENFAFTFTGLIEIPKDGKYTFYLNSNDGSILKLDEYLLIENDGPHGAFEKEAPVTLQKGFHSIEIKYFQTGGDKKLLFSWKGPEINKSEVPASVLFHVE